MDGLLVLDKPGGITSRDAVNRLLKEAHGRTRLWIRKTEPRRQCKTRELVRSFQRPSKQSQGWTMFTICTFGPLNRAW